MSTQRRRDDLEPLLSAPGLYDLVGADGPCPDPETIAAFADRGLDPGERARCEVHLSSCARCQHVLATVLRAADAEPAVSAAAVAGARRRWLWWVTPAGLAAAAAVAWFVVRPIAPPLPSRGTEPTASVARSEASPPEAPPQQPSMVPPVEVPAGRVALDVASKGDAPATRVAAKAQPATSDVPPLQAKREAQVERLEPEEPGLRAAVMPPAEPSAATGVTAPSPLPAQAKEAATQMAYRPAAAAPPAPVQPPAAKGGAALGAQAVPHSEASQAEARTAARRAVFAIPTEISTPGSEVRWRLEPGGRVSRRTTPGAAWTVVFEDPLLEFTAGASPSPDVCWVATRQGDVLVTRDGRSWSRHKVAAPDDILAIAATDARAATVTLRSGLRLNTTDGGATWQPDR